MRIAVLFALVALAGCAPASSASEAPREGPSSEAPPSVVPPREAPPSPGASPEGPSGPADPLEASPTAPPCPPPYVRGAELGWPDDPDRLVAHLDGWDRSELEAYARPELDPRRTTAGETNAWVEQHLERLAAMGVEVVWNAEERCYARVP